LISFEYLFLPEDDEGFLHEFSLRGPLFEADDAEVEAADAWCHEHFGPPGFGEECRWVANSTLNAYWFRNELDAFTFRIRWG
jgi:hypothetical protein